MVERHPNPVTALGQHWCDKQLIFLRGGSGGGGKQAMCGSRSSSSPTATVHTRYPRRGGRGVERHPNPVTALGEHCCKQQATRFQHGGEGGGM